MGVEPRPVERVGHLADQPLGGSARQAGIGVEGDHIADPGRHDSGLSADCEEGRVDRPAEQAIQLVKFSALAFPSHPLSFRLVPPSPAMEQEKSLPIQCAAVALVEARDRGGGRAEKLVVAWRIFSCGIGPVREQSEAKVAVLTRQIMNLQAFDLLLEFLPCRQKSGHHDNRAQPGRHSIVKLQSRQGCRFDADRDGAVHQRHGRVHRGNHRENRENEASPSADAGLHESEQRAGRAKSR